MAEQFYANRYASILYRYSQRFLTDQLRRESLPLESAQIPVFLRCAHRPGITQEEVAFATGLDKATVARTAAALEGRGLVRRTPDPGDRRVNRLALTAQGEALLGAVEEVVDRLHRAIYRGLSAQEQDIACRLLVQMCDNLRGAVEQGRTGRCCGASSKTAQMGQNPADLAQEHC